jgi:hypothetical protein
MNIPKSVMPMTASQPSKKPDQTERRTSIWHGWIIRLVHSWSAPEATGIAYYSQSIIQRDFLNTSKIDSDVSHDQERDSPGEN